LLGSSSFIISICFSFGLWFYKRSVIIVIFSCSFLLFDHRNIFRRLWNWLYWIQNCFYFTILFLNYFSCRHMRILVWINSWTLFLWWNFLMRSWFIICFWIKLLLLFPFLSFCFRIYCLIFSLVGMKIKIIKWRVESYRLFINLRVFYFFIITQINIYNTFKFDLLIFYNVGPRFSIIFYNFYIFSVLFIQFLNRRLY